MAQVPTGSMALDAPGNIHGTTYEGGVFDSGVAFDRTP
jgi:hypothetical protein